MGELKGSIYLRDSECCQIHNAIKLGITKSIKDRASTYITGEIKRGQYIKVIEIPLSKMRILDKLLKSYFSQYNVYIDGGTEFYSRTIIDMIEPYLQKLNIDYKVLTSEEINLLDRLERMRHLKNMTRIKKIFNSLNLAKIIAHYRIKRESRELIKPKEHQQYILDNISDFYSVNNIGKIIWACGLGKALLSILIVRLLKFKSIIFGVPSNNLQRQIMNEIIRLYSDKTNILFVGGEYYEGIQATTDKEEIIQFLENNTNTQPKFIITTYHSCYLLADPNISVDFKIGDEAHHLVGSEHDEAGFRSFHRIQSKKTLYMTATEKIISKNSDVPAYSMDNEAIFGKCIDSKSVQWAIENKKITDYNILVLKNTEQEVNTIIDTLGIVANSFNKELFISCYMCLKSMGKYSKLTHVLLYTNTTEEADLANKYINEILALNVLSFSREHIYSNSLHSKSSGNLDGEIAKFKTSPLGIVSCVYIFGEGYDLPKLNGVCIAGNMQSIIRIVQYILRANRLEQGNPDKIAFVILPYIDFEDWDTENKSFDKIRSVISQMRNVDESIEQKIQVLSSGKRSEQVDKERVPKYACPGNYELEENIQELDKIKLRLRYSKDLKSKSTEEQDEYNYIRSINQSLGIKSKSEYMGIEHFHSNYIKSPEEYFKAKGVWNTWYDFLGIDTSKFIQSKEEWINCCKEKNIKSLSDYIASCDLYDVLPREPKEFYKNFSNILEELELKLERKRLIP